MTQARHVLRPVGAIDARAAHEIETLVATLARTSALITLDLSEAAFASYGGLRLAVRCRRAGHAAGARVRLRSRVRPLERVLEIVMVDELPLPSDGGV